MSGRRGVKAARIGSGLGYFVAGWAAIVVGVFVGLASSASLEPDGGATAASALVALGVALIGLGFWIKLFGLIELRLMDIEERMTPEAPAEDSTAPTARPDPTTADPYLG